MRRPLEEECVPLRSRCDELILLRAKLARQEAEYQEMIQQLRVQCHAPPSALLDEYECQWRDRQGALLVAEEVTHAPST